MGSIGCFSWRLVQTDEGAQSFRLGTGAALWGSQRGFVALREFNQWTQEVGFPALWVSMTEVVGVGGGVRLFG